MKWGGGERADNDGVHAPTSIDFADCIFLPLQIESPLIHLSLVTKTLNDHHGEQPSIPPALLPTKPPSPLPTHAPLKYGDFRREFWCGLTYFDALERCPMRCPSGGDDECATHQVHGDISSLGLKCMSGVTDCKVEQGLGAYGIEAEEVDDSIVADETTVNVEGGDSTSDPSVQADISVSDGTVATADASATTVDEEAPTSPPTTGLPLQGPFENEMVRIILYGLNATAFMDDTSSMDRWKSITESYI